MDRARGGRKPAVIVKRYSGGRYYDATAPRYLSLDELRRMGQDGIDFIVYDAGTGENVTRTFQCPPH